MDCFEMLLSGGLSNIINAAVCPFTNIPQFGPWFFALVIFGIEAAIYLKTENLMIPSVLGLFISAFFISGSFNLYNIGLPGSFLAAATIMFALNVAVIIYSVFK